MISGKSHTDFQIEAPIIPKSDNLALITLIWFMIPSSRLVCSENKQRANTLYSFSVSHRPNRVGGSIRLRGAPARLSFQNWAVKLGDLYSQSCFKSSFKRAIVVSRRLTRDSSRDFNRSECFKFTWVRSYSRHEPLITSR